MTKNTLRIPIAFFVMMLLMYSCKKTDDAALPRNPSQPVAKNVVEQLKVSQENITSRGLSAKIISYKFLSAIQNNDQLAAIQEKLLDVNNYVPQYNGFDASTFSVKTIKERISAADRTPEDATIIENIRKMAFPDIKTGQKVLDIVWEAGGKQFHSTCIYNDNGIVYDNMLSNLLMVEAETLPQESIKAGISGSNTSTGGNNSRVQAQYSFTTTVVNYTITWIWGGTRGRIIIKHYIIWNGINYIYDHGGTTDAWMTTGSASARWANNYLSRYSRSKMAWAYGWATPTASFNISFNSSTLTFSVSTGGIGSKGSGSGVHTIYLP